MEALTTDKVIPLVIGFAIIYGGYHFLRQKAPSITTRFMLGLSLLVVGIGCGYYLIFVAESLEQHPILVGLAIGAAGLGINQATAPLRATMGGAA